MKTLIPDYLGLTSEVDVTKKSKPLMREDIVLKLMRELKMERKEANAVLQAFLDTIIDAVKHGEKVVIQSVFSFRRAGPSKAFEFKSPKNGKVYDVPAKYKPHFTPGEGLKRLVNGKEFILVKES